ncbi:MAG: AAA family ATPase, partial [Streptosporangiaceae bacterium]
GEVGAGKTAALRAAADGLDASRHTLIYLPNPQVGVRGIHGALATALGKAPCFYTADLIPQVEAALAAEADERNRNVILAIDESHMLTGDQLEAVRMITNHNLDSGSPLTVLLIGQPTLRRRLRVGDMAALDQRVQLRCVIPSPAVTATEADGYLRAHLAHAPLTELPAGGSRIGGHCLVRLVTFPGHDRTGRLTPGSGRTGRCPHWRAAGDRGPLGALSAG